MVPQTLGLSLVILLLSVILGTLYWKMQGSRFRIPRLIYQILNSYFRGIPLLIHLLIFYYGIPIVVKVVSSRFNLGININQISSMYAVVISYTLYSATFLEEIIRGSFKSVGEDQLEAAAALGYTSGQSFWAVKLPQALSDAIPKILNYYTLLIRQLSLAFLVSVVDIFAKAKIQSATNDGYVEAFTAAAIVYWIVCIVLTLIFSRVEDYLRRSDRRVLA